MSAASKHGSRAILTVLVGFLYVASLLVSVVPASGAGGGPVVFPPEVSVPDVNFGEAYAPPPPVWYTPEIHENVREASAQGLGYNVAIDEMVPVSVDFIQPGAKMVWPSQCTMGFVTAVDEITTAGHCFGKPSESSLPINPDKKKSEVRKMIAEPDEDDAVVIQAAPYAPDVFVEIGTSGIVSASPDYATVDIDEQWQPNVNPRVQGIGGPQGGLYEGGASPEDPVPAKFTGHTATWGTMGVPRVGDITHVIPDDDLFYCWCPNVPGDSGGPVLTASGEALGIISGYAYVGYSWMKGTLMRGVVSSVENQGSPNPSACANPPHITLQGLDTTVQRIKQITTDASDELGTTAADPGDGWLVEAWVDQRGPLLTVYDDEDGDGNVDDGERYSNKQREAAWATDRTGGSGWEDSSESQCEVSA